MKQIVPKSSKPSVANPSTEDLENSFRAVLTPADAETTVKKNAASVRKNSPAPKPLIKRDGKTRLTIDIPDNLYQLLEKHKEEHGQNYTFIIVSLLKKHFQTK